MAPGEASSGRTRACDGGSRRRAGGFAYLWVMFFIALAGAGLAAAGVVWETRVRREKEADLLFVGHEFRRAIADYYRNTPQAAKELPQRLEQLVEDRRGPQVRRYLRRVYPDPMSGKPGWGLIASEGRISGVYSLASGVPIKRGGFAPADAGFADAPRYSAWRFAFAASAAPVAGAEGSAAAGAPEAGAVAVTALPPGGAVPPPPGAIAAPQLPAEAARVITPDAAQERRGRI